MIFAKIVIIKYFIIWYNYCYNAFWIYTIAYNNDYTTVQVIIY